MINRPSLKGGGCCLFTLTLSRFSLAYIQRRLWFCFDTVSAFQFFVSGRELMRTNATCNSVPRLLGWGEAARVEMVSGCHSFLQALPSSATIPSSAPDGRVWPLVLLLKILERLLVPSQAGPRWAFTDSAPLPQGHQVYAHHASPEPLPLRASG